MIPLVDLKAQYNSIKDEVDGAIQNILDSSQFIMGPPVKEFEENLANFCGAKYAVGTSSGSSALFLALKAYGIKEGDEVITPVNSFIATAEAIVQCGAKPVFTDIVEETMLMDVNQIKGLINENTKAIIPVHLYGQPVDVDRIKQIAPNIPIIEDAAQAIGTKQNEASVPLHETATISFFPAKNLGCYGDGGAIVTHNETIANQVRKLKDHGRISKYESDIIGYGARLDALQAAILDVKLKHLSKWTELRQQKAKLYDKLLDGITGITVPTIQKGSYHVYYMYVIRVKKRDELMQFLKDNQIASGIHYPVPLHLQKSLADLNYVQGDFPIAEKYAKEILSLPLYPEIQDTDIGKVVEKIKEFQNVE